MWWYYFFRAPQGDSEGSTPEALDARGAGIEEGEEISAPGDAALHT
jgi:hypothetical protein